MRGCALVLVTACSSHAATPMPDAAPPPDATVDAQAPDSYQSGTRVKVQRLAIGAASVPYHLIDTQLGFTCNFLVFADGNTYCAPAGDEVVYADAACTQAVTQHPLGPGCVPKSTGFGLELAPPDACSQRPVAHVYRSGAPTTVTSIYVSDNAGGCFGPYDASGSSYSSAEDVTSQLVRIDLDPPPQGSGRLLQRTLSTADGFHAPAGPYDTTLATDCGLDAPLDTAIVPCAPLAGFAYEFHDASCTTPVVSQGAACPAPRFGVAAGQCPNGALTYFTVTPTATPPLYTGSGASCAAETADPDDAYYVEDTVVTPATANRAHDVAVGQRIEQSYFDAAGTRIADFTLFDSMLDHDCSLAESSDGTVRCLPPTADVTAYYGDPGCQTELDLVDVPVAPTGCSPTPVPVYGAMWSAPTGDQCVEDATIYLVADAYVGTAYSKSGSTCQAVDDPGVVHFRLGAMVSDFATDTTVTTDP